MAQTVLGKRKNLFLSNYEGVDWRAALAEFLDHQKAVHEENTHDMYEAQLRLLVNWMEERSVTLQEFGARDLDKYLGWRKLQPSKLDPDKTISDNTRRKDALCCKVFVKFCCQRALIERDPLGDYKLPHGNRKLQECPTEDEIRGYLRAVDRYWNPERNPSIRNINPRRRKFNQTRHKAIIVGLAQTGAREGEMLSLTMDDYDPVELSVVFRDTKTDVDREVPIKAEWAEVVAEYLKWRPKSSTSKNVFVNEFGEPMVTDVFGRSFRDMRDYINRCPSCLGKKKVEGNECVDCGGKGKISPLAMKWTLHGLRRYAGTALCDRVGIDKAQEILGHKSIETTQLYNYVHRDRLRQAYETANLLPLDVEDEPPILVNKRSEKNRKRRLV